MKFYRSLSARNYYVASILAMAPIAAFAQVMTVSQIPTIQKSPGVYEIVDRSAIEINKMQWNQSVLQQDRKQYERAVSETQTAFQEMVGRCTGTSAASCTGFNKLKNISNATAKSKSYEISISDLNTAIADYITTRTTFVEKLNSIAVTQEIFNNTQDAPGSTAYKMGSLNLARFAAVYQDAIAKLDAAAASLTYRYKSGMGVKETAAGMGLESPTSADTPDVIKRKFAEVRENLKLSIQDRETVGFMSRALSQQMLSYVDSNEWKLYWKNGYQQAGAKDWQDSLKKQARILKYLRGVYCMPLGTPAIAIPINTPGIFGMATEMLKYLNRGVDRSNFRLVDKTEYEAANIRTTLNRFDQLFASIESQSGGKNSVKGVKGMLHRLNSSVTWKNQVEAYMGIMRILRTNMLDELALLDGNCDLVRERYYADYKTFNDDAFDNVLNQFISGFAPGWNTNSVNEAFVDAGVIIQAKGAYWVDFMELQKQHPLTNPLARDRRGLR